MSVRSGQSVTTVFPTRSFSTGAAVNADSLPTGVLYLNGMANGAAVTVTNITTGLYSAAATLPAMAVGDVAAIVISATVAAVAGNAKVWEDSVGAVFDASGNTASNIKQVNSVPVNGAGTPASPWGP